MSRQARLQSLILCIGLTLLSGCGGHVYHVVERGETLYSIGWLYGYDYRRIARWNNVQPPYSLNEGQRLRVIPPESEAANRVTSPVHLAPERVKESIAKVDKPAAVLHPEGDSSLVHATALVWSWPVKDAQVARFFDGSTPGSRGLSISGTYGQPIYAAADGYVVYSGSGLRRYGKLIIIKHDDMYLSAYAHNRILLVKEGDHLTRGQQIAEMGRTSGSRVKLHFEIRRNGKPVDPLRYLPKPAP